MTSDHLNGSGNQVDAELLPLLPELAKPSIKLIALDAVSNNGYRTNMTVTVEPAPGFPVEKLASQEFVDQYASGFPAITKVGYEVVSLPAGKAAHLWYTYRSPKSEADRVITTHEYNLFAGGKAYTIYANVLPGVEDDYLKTFLDSARSLRPLP